MDRRWVGPLKLTNPDDKALTEGKVYNFSFAVYVTAAPPGGHHVLFDKFVSERVNFLML